MKRSLALSFAVLLAVAPVFGQAKPSAGQRRMDYDALPTLRDFSRCVVDRRYNDAMRFLMSDARGKAYLTLLGRVTDNGSSCVLRNSGFEVGGFLLKGGLAEAVLAHDGMLDMVAARIKAAPPVQAHSQPEYFSLCVGKTSPAATAAILLSKPGSTEEDGAFKDAAPVMAGCLARDQKFEINKPTLRALLALAAFRFVYVAPAAPKES